MGNLLNELNSLREKVRELEQKNESITSEITGLYSRIKELRDLIEEKGVTYEMDVTSLKNRPNEKESPGKDETESSAPEEDIPEYKKELQEESKPQYSASEYNSGQKKRVTRKRVANKKPKGSSDWEKLVGENLINKVGILILVIGLGIGVKYAIDHNLISPLTRVILAYIVSFSLLAVSFKIKKKYFDFSAVLLSGSMAANYFITYFAYDSYGLIPQIIAFLLMVIFTAFTVFSALKFDRQIIAHLGLVGAYGVPFLLSSGSGRADILFSYISIVNIGILVLSFRKSWKSLFYSSFGLTWLIYTFWFNTSYSRSEYFAVASIFCAVIFITFYITFLVFKTTNYKKLKPQDILVIIVNSLLFYGFGSILVADSRANIDLNGLFTALNGVIHAIVALYIKKKELSNQTLYYFTLGLVITFATLAIPVQLDGNWVTLIWIFEAAILFWISRKQKIYFYEKFSLAILPIAIISLAGDLGDAYNIEDPVELRSFFNIEFLTLLIFSSTLALMTYLNFKFEREQVKDNKRVLFGLFDYLLPLILAVSTYATFYLEINYSFLKLYYNSTLTIDESYFNTNFLKMKNMVLIIYTMVYFSLITSFNQLKLKSDTLNKYLIAFNSVVVVIFMTAGLLVLSQLRENYLNFEYSEYFEISSFNILIRYISLGIFGFLVWQTYKLKSIIEEHISESVFEVIVHGLAVWLLSSELLHWLDFTGIENIYKVGLTILWGLYSIMLIVIGIKKSKKHLRISAIVLLGISVGKLVFYDTVQLDTIKKTILYVSLGIVLLIVSFLYNKFKNTIFPADEE